MKKKVNPKRGVVTMRRAGIVKRPGLRRVVVNRPSVETCICGGRVRPAMLKNFDFTFYAGMPVTLARVAGVRCDNCQKGFILEGKTIETIVRGLVMTVLGQVPRLNKDQSRFLRRRLQLTQQELADRMGLARETIAYWETGAAEISPQHDYILRGIAVVELIGSANDNLVPAINAVHTDAPAAVEPITVEAQR